MLTIQKMIFKHISRTNFKVVFILLICLQWFGACFAQHKNQNVPNVILILTNDQGNGDFGCYGTPWLKTPNIDAFYEESIRIKDFHVSPLYTPHVTLPLQEDIVTFKVYLSKGKTLLFNDFYRR
jgi:hypothetical protein